MSLDVVIGLVGVIVTVLVVVGMTLITPRGLDTSHLPAEPSASNDLRSFDADADADADADPARTALSSTTKLAICRGLAHNGRSRPRHTRRTGGASRCQASQPSS
jgi:hypothetical protein